MLFASHSTNRLKSFVMKQWQNPTCSVLKYFSLKRMNNELCASHHSSLIQHVLRNKMAASEFIPVTHWKKMHLCVMFSYLSAYLGECISDLEVR